MVHICGRNIKVQTGAKTQTVNICSSVNIHGQYDYIIRLRPPSVSPEMLLSQNFKSIADLVQYLERNHRGQIERSPNTRSASPIQAQGLVHPLLDGVEAICREYRYLDNRHGLFNRIYESIRTNWFRFREPDRFPSSANWVLRVARDFTFDATRRIEKQLQKQIAICLENEDWGNDVPTASGLVNSHGRQMNIDLAHRITDGFEFVELKVSADDPYKAACQIMRYGAVYMLYRLQPELASRFRSNAMIRARLIVLEVLAPCDYYVGSDVDLLSLEQQLNEELARFATEHSVGVSLSFRFRALPRGFRYQPGMTCGPIGDAVLGRTSPFAGPLEPECSETLDADCARVVEMRGHNGQVIESFTDWVQHALPRERHAKHWKEGRSEFELARTWTERGVVAVPRRIMELLDSHGGTKRTNVRTGRTQRETPLPFGEHAPRCHDLALQAERDGCGTTICVEAKADETFGRTVAEELQEARKRPETRLPERLQWLTRSLFGKLPGTPLKVATLGTA